MKVYLDNGATTYVDKKVAKAMQTYFTQIYGNAHSSHIQGKQAERVLEESRETIAKAIRARTDEIIFTSGGSESNNLAIKGVAYTFKQKKKTHIINSAIEHPSVLETCKALEKQGFSVTYLPVNKKGLVNPKDLKEAITEKTALVSIMLANNEIGTIQPIKKLSKICKQKRVLLHTDSVQGFTKIPLDAKDIDLASFSAHKIHGPKGIGALYVRRGIKLARQIHGGPQESKLRAGTENIPGIVGFAQAVKLCKGKETKRMTFLRNMLIKNTLKQIPNVNLNGHPEKRLCNNVNLSFSYVEGEAIGAYLDVVGICSSTGSACSARDSKPSHVLTAIGLTHEQAQGSLRLTLSRYTTKEEIEYVVEKLTDIIKKLRRISPLAKTS